jgi:hypothetical protein
LFVIHMNQYFVVLKIMNLIGQKNAKAFLLLNDQKVLVQLILDLRNRI